MRARGQRRQGRARRRAGLLQVSAPVLARNLSLNEHVLPEQHPLHSHSDAHQCAVAACVAACVVGSGAHHPSMVFLRVQKGADGSFFQLHACSLTPNGETDNNSLHGSCPTTKGEKWSATKWIHVGPFGGTSEAQRAKWCARSPS